MDWLNSIVDFLRGDQEDPMERFRREKAPLVYSDSKAYKPDQHMRIRNFDLSQEMGYNYGGGEHYTPQQLNDVIKAQELARQLRVRTKKGSV